MPLLLLAGCSLTPSPAERSQSAQALAAEKNWHLEILPAGNFDLAVFLPEDHDPSDRLTLYIEGDGFAWVTPSQPSLNPTPIDALALQLALRHPNGDTVAYLARPCQFTEGEARRNCSNRYWTDQRFAEEVVDAANQATEQLKARMGAREIELIGYSGGGAIAALLAARRDDVARLITVAGNLDHATWTEQQEISSLTGSLNPADEWSALKDTAQHHFVGEKDDVVPPQVAAAFRARFIQGSEPDIITVSDFDHHCCWVDDWPRLLRKLAD